MNKAMFIMCLMLLIFFADSCEKIRSYPPEPHIQYLSYNLSYAKDTLQNNVRVLSVSFSFEDGDGDLFNDSVRSDSTSKIYYIFYQLINGVKVKVPDHALPDAFNFPWNPAMERGGQNKLQKGVITFNYLFNYPLPFDTLNVAFYVTDGKMHKSNLDAIPENVILK